MTAREKAFSKLSRNRIADYIEYSAFASLALSVLSLAGKGLAVAFGLVGILATGPFVTAAIGFFITAISLVIFTIILDYETVLEAALEETEEVEASEEDGPREVDVQQARHDPR